MSQIWTIYLMRHGEAAWTSPDSERELTLHGIDQTQRVLQQLNELNKLQQIHCSPFTRAQQTAREVESLTGLKANQHASLTPDEPPQYTLEALAPYMQDQTLIVAHQPLLGNLLSLLVKGDFSDPYPFGTSEIVQLEMEDWAPGCGRLMRSYHP